MTGVIIIAREASGTLLINHFRFVDMDSLQLTEQH